MPIPRLTFLLDTNELIPLEPFAAPAPLEVASLLAEASRHGHRVVVHPANRDDLSEDADDARREQMLAALMKYEMLEESPISDSLRSAAGDSEPGTNDHRDLRLLAAVDSGSATFLVTEDRRLRARASRAGLSQSVPRLQGALELLAALHPRDATPPPTVEMVAAYRIDLQQPIFDTLRADYEGFDDWFKTSVAPDAPNRRCWVVRDPSGAYDAIAIVKVADADPEDALKTATKLSTFKVEAHRSGDKVGELLIRTVLEWAASQRIERLFVEVRPDKESLIRFLEVFGFEPSSAAPRANGDRAWMKRLRPTESSVGAFEYHVRFGPPAVHPDAPAFVVPIQPHWYFGLFPDSPTFGQFGGVPLGGTALAPATPFGNAIRKAYLCRSPTRSIPRGATLYFYRSAVTGGGRGGGAVQAVGVTEQVVRSSSSERIVSFVGRRTVYTAEDVAAMCDGGRREVLATLFRHDHYLEEPVGLAELISEGILRGAPQSITEIRSEEARTWLSTRPSASL